MTKQPRGANRPPTDGLPKTEPLTASQLHQNAAAKRMLRRLVQGGKSADGATEHRGPARREPLRQSHDPGGRDR
jgi:hypothetical protein